MDNLIETLSQFSWFLWIVICIILGCYILFLIVVPVVVSLGILIYGFSLVPMAHFRAWKMKRKADKMVRDIEKKERAARAEGSDRVWREFQGAKNEKDQ